MSKVTPSLIDTLRCAGHTIQLTVNHALKDPQISRALGAARERVSYFHSSDVALLKLKAKQEQMGTPQHKLTQDVAVRWNSSYYMITRLLEQRWPVTATLSDPQVTKASKCYLDMKADQWSLLEELQKALEPFEQATVFLSGEAYVTGSVLPPLAKFYLGAPATSTPSERLFSAAGTIVSKKRASLTEDHVDMLTFLHSNSE